MIHTYSIDGLSVQTGDIVCTMNGKPDILPGEFWRLVGRLVPGDVDHIAIYILRSPAPLKRNPIPSRVGFCEERPLGANPPILLKTTIVPPRFTKKIL